MSIVIGDIHAEYDLLMKMFDIIPHDDVCFVGDLIDRGPDAKKVVDFVKNNNYNIVMGNHEDFAIQSYVEEDNIIDHEISEYFFVHRLWQSRRNGGWNTLQSYKNIDDFFEHREWFKTLPLLHWIDDKTVVSHSYYVPYIGQEKQKDFADNVLWERKHKVIDNGITNIVGHSIVANVAFYGNYINVDTGSHAYGKLSAYDTETKEIYTIEKD